MSNLLSQSIEQISREKGINPEIIQEALEDAMVAAARKYFKTEEDLQARYDPETGTIDVFAVKRSWRKSMTILSKCRSRKHWVSMRHLS